MSTKIAFVLLVLSIGFEHIQSDSCVYETDIDYVGSPNANDIGSVSSSSASNCCSQCSSQPIQRCGAWTYSSGTCFFKSHVGVKTFSAGRTSGPRVENISSSAPMLGSHVILFFVINLHLIVRQL